MDFMAQWGMMKFLIPVHNGLTLTAAGDLIKADQGTRRCCFLPGGRGLLRGSGASHFSSVALKLVVPFTHSEQLSHLHPS